MKNTKLNREMFPVLMRLQDAEERYQASHDELLALWVQLPYPQRPVSLTRRIGSLQQRLQQVKTLRVRLCWLMPILALMGVAVFMLLSICLGGIWAVLNDTGYQASGIAKLAVRAVVVLLLIFYFYGVVPWIRREVIEREMTDMAVQDAMDASEWSQSFRR